MGSVVELYEALASAPDERARARVIAEAFERLEERYPNLPNLVTHQQLGETELRIRREIEQLRGDLRATELRLQKEIEQLRGELKTEIEQLRGEVKTEIEQLRGEVKTEIEQLRGEVRTAIERSRNSLLMWLIPLMFAQVGAMAALVKLL
jgi:type VI protein secretion system component VasF